MRVDLHRRREIAATSAALLDDLLVEVLAGWAEGSAPGGAPHVSEHVRSASQAALQALVTVFEQGDIDEAASEQVRDRVLAATADPDEADELLRTIRIIGVGRLGDLLTERIKLTAEERWLLQREAWAIGSQLLGRREAPDPQTVEELLAELAREEVDLA